MNHRFMVGIQAEDKSHIFIDWELDYLSLERKNLCRLSFLFKIKSVLVVNSIIYFLRIFLNVKNYWSCSCFIEGNEIGLNRAIISILSDIMTVILEVSDNQAMFFEE